MYIGLDMTLVYAMGVYIRKRSRKFAKSFWDNANINSSNVRMV